MDLVEIRDLDGPNILLLEPAIKVEFFSAGHDDDERALAALNAARSSFDSRVTPATTLPDALVGTISDLHRLIGAPAPEALVEQLETPGHVALAFGWNHRRTAMEMARQLAQVVISGQGSGFDIDAIARLRDSHDVDDAPAMIQDEERTARIVSVTGTNGKTTTTRLIAHIGRTAHMSVGWTSTAGIFVNGDMIEDGDWAGPSGARRILNDAGVELAVLETARGGILLRGLSYESNEVSVFTNISADHVGLQGVLSVEGLARVKATVCRITRPNGMVVVNADDPLVVAATADVRAPRMLVSQVDGNSAVTNHLSTQGAALLLLQGLFRWFDGTAWTTLIAVEDIPVTLRGVSREMIEDALCAAGAALALGIPPELVAAGLRSFRNTTEQNRGRMNLFDVSGVTVILDFAHHDVGLRGLLNVAAKLRASGGRIISVIGTAGDRTDDGLRDIGRVAAEKGDQVIVKETVKYLRGRTNEEMNALLIDGARQGGNDHAAVAADEITGLRMALEAAKPGDVIALMAQEQVSEQLALLEQIGVPNG